MQGALDSTSKCLEAANGLNTFFQEQKHLLDHLTHLPHGSYCLSVQAPQSTTYAASWYSFQSIFGNFLGKDAAFGTAGAISIAMISFAV